MNPRIGIYFAYWERNWQADYAYYLHKAKSLGIDTLEVAAGALTELSQTALQQLADTARREQMDMTYCIGLPAQYDVASSDEKIRRNGVAYVKQLLERIHVLGGDLLGGILYGAWPAATDSMDVKARARENSLRSMREIAKVAEEQQVCCCLEVVNRFEQYLLNTAAEGVDFVRELDSPNVKLLLDTFHMNIEEDFIGDAIRSAAGHVGHFHIGECNRKTPGNGHMPWEEIMEALRDIRYEGRIVMEPFVKTGGEVGRDIRMYHDLSGNATDAEMDNMAREACAFIRRKQEQAYAGAEKPAEKKG